MLSLLNFKWHSSKILLLLLNTRHIQQNSQQQLPNNQEKLVKKQNPLQHINEIHCITTCTTERNTVVHPRTGIGIWHWDQTYSSSFWLSSLTSRIMSSIRRIVIAASVANWRQIKNSNNRKKELIKLLKKNFHPNSGS